MFELNTDSFQNLLPGLLGHDLLSSLEHISLRRTVTKVFQAHRYFHVKFLVQTLHI